MTLASTVSRSLRSITRLATTNRVKLDLGTKLENEIEAVFATIVQFPQAAPQWRTRPDRRIAVFDRFPFTMPYQIKDDEIVILALAHTRRRPGYWSRRRED